MHKTSILLFVFFIITVSCKNTKNTTDKLKITKTYFEALSQSNSSKIKTLLSDSLTTAIPKYDYKITFSKNDYVEKWLQWDSVFEPTYKILDLRLENDNVIAKISKTDKRIMFLMQKPFITTETLKFKDHKISTIVTEYLNFDETTWEKNKNELLNWVKDNHPHLNDFIYDQTASGGEKFLKAIKLFQNKSL